MGRVLALFAPSVVGLVLAAGLVTGVTDAQGRSRSVEACPERPLPGDAVPEPDELRSIDGVLAVDLTLHNERSRDGAERYCYRSGHGGEAPTLRVHPGDLVVLHLTNYLESLDGGADGAAAHSAHAGHVRPESGAPAPPAAARSDPCTSGVMTATATNLHFHGLTMPPVCHQDEVLRTSIQPGDPPFEYRFRIPDDEAPGLNWYHPHVHGFSSKQVSGGASGALIIEGLERAIPEVAGLPERVFVIRDPSLLHPDASPSSAEPVVPKPVLDADGDAANNGGYGKPARDLSVNFVPAPYPDYPPARIVLRPHERQLWRVLNASAITYVHLTLLYDRVPQPLGVVALDGVPINRGDPAADHVKTVDHISVPPGGRVELIVEGPPLGVHGLLISRTVNTGQDGENDPNRPLASVDAASTAPEPRSRLPAASVPLPAPVRPWIGSVDPVRVRKLYFSERRADPADPKSPTLFFITVDGDTPTIFDPAAPLPNIVARQGDVEDWIIENRSLEVHAFHIHQIHFQLREWFGYRVNEPFLRDTVEVPFFDNHMTSYPSVRVRMDFRDPNTVGTFVYHCHLLEHEDGGMMGTIRVDPAGAAGTATSVAPR